MTRHLETSARLLGRVHAACRLVLALTATTALPSCSTRGVTAGGESNWLETCDTDAACGELAACRCGICTSNCAVTADCNGFERATCANGAAADAQCADSAMVTSVCLPTCSDTRPCPDEQACVDGACTLTSTMMAQGGSGGASGGSGGSGADCTGPNGCVSSSGSSNGGEFNGGAGGTTADNPSGDCTAADDGGRLDDNTPDVTDTYLPDCQLELARDYYRVFRKEDGSAYLFPRPDGNPDLFAPCTDSEHELAGIVERYLLCESAESEAATDLVNAMDPRDALLLARYLHAQLVFYPAGALGVTPPPFRDDLLAACKTDDVFRGGLIAEHCDFELMYENTARRPNLNYFYDEAQAVALSVKLNEIYGISGSELDASMDPVCERLGASAKSVVQVAALEADRSCITDEDCLLWINYPCYDAGECGEAILVSDTTTLNAAFATIEIEQCGFFSSLGCEPPGVAPCTYNTEHTCRDNVCE